MKGLNCTALTSVLTVGSFQGCGVYVLLESLQVALHQNVRFNCLMYKQTFFCVTPVTAWPSMTASAAGDEEDRDEDQRSYQEDGEDHQDEHVAILLLLGLEWDLLRKKDGKIKWTSIGKKGKKESKRRKRGRRLPV